MIHFYVITIYFTDGEIFSSQYTKSQLILELGMLVSSEVFIFFKKNASIGRNSINGGLGAKVHQ